MWDRRGAKKLETELLWGHNREHRKIWDLKLLWSENTRNSIYKYVEDSRNLNLKVSGATGFDSYTLLEFDGKDVLQKFEKQRYKKVILLVGFAFDLYPTYDLDKLHMSKEVVEWLYGQRFHVRDIYKKLIEQNPDILFILKHHPGSMNLEDTEFAEIMNIYDNTITIHKECNIRELLSASSMVIAFDSTVCLEAWLLNIPTVLINPEEGEFARSWNYFGSPIVRTADKLQGIIDEFFREGHICEFDSLKQTREDMIKKQIMFDDGFNYLRAAKLIDEEMKIDNYHEADNEVRKLMVTKLSREALEFLVEKQPIGIIKKEARKCYRKRSERYDENRRIISTKKYRNGIKKIESENFSKVEDILKNYEG